MKIDGIDWMDWLHQLRAESEAERKRQGISIAEATADRIEQELSGLSAPVARDKPPA